MSDVYTLICYRPNGADYCRGCLMETSDSNYDLWIDTKIDYIAQKWADKLFSDHTRKKYSAVCSWEITLLVNGHQDSTFLPESYDANGAYVDADYDFRREVEQLVGRAYQALIEKEQRGVEEEEHKKQVALAAETERKRIAKEEHDRKEYARLQTKFSNTPKTLEEQVQELRSSDSYEFDDGA